jgi:tetratricopeptide (TPR) repeat protein
MARPPSAGYRVGKFVTRHRAAVIGASAVLAAMILGIVGTTIGLVRANDQRDKAIKAEAAAVEQRKVAEIARENEKNANLFLRDLMISFGNPAEGRTGVERAAKRLDEGWLKDQPDTQMAARIAIGMFLIQENKGQQAERQFDAVLSMARRPDGTVPPDISGVIHSGRGMARWMRKQLPEAEGELRAAIDDYRKVPGMGAKVAQLLFALSAVRQAMGDMTEAQKFLREATEIAASEPTMRGFVPGAEEVTEGVAPAPDPSMFLAAARFDDARRGYQRAIEEEPSNHWNWYHLACVQMYLGDDAGWRKTAAAMLERFGNTKTANVGERTAKTCLLSPRPAGDMAKIQALVDQALASEPAGGRNLPWFATTKALAEYRAGRFDSALQFLEKTDSFKAASAIATVDLLRAMIHHKLGHADRANEFLTRATDRIEKDLPKAGAQPITSPENWLICHVLRREAEQLIAPKAPAAAETNK